MKIVLLLALLVCFIHPAYADETKTFGPDFARFSVTVPTGWRADAQESGCLLQSADNKTALSVQIYGSVTQSANEIADILITQLGVKIHKTDSNGFNEMVVYGEMDGVRIVLLITVKDETCMVVTFAGSDSQGLEKIFDSMQDANA